MTLRQGGVSVLDDIRTWLRAEGVEFREIEHDPTRTSEESARARGEDMRVGAKALLMKIGDEFRLFVLSAALRADARAIRKHFGARRGRFASAEELFEMTGLVPGSVPPFGSPILPFPLFVDPSIAANPRIAFNAGSLTRSMVLSVEDYLRVARPEIFEFAARAD